MVLNIGTKNSTFDGVFPQDSDAVRMRLDGCMES